MKVSKYETQNQIDQNRQADFDINEDLFVRIAENDMDALRELFEKSQRAIYVFTLSILKDPDDARDVTQETYIKIRSAAHLYTPMGKPMAWMYTISRNLAISKIRQRQKFSDTEWDTKHDPQTTAHIEHAEDRMVLQAAMEILSQDESDIILLHAVSGFKHREIAELMNSPLSTVLSKYNRALKKLKRYLSEQEYEKK